MSKYFNNLVTNLKLKLWFSAQTSVHSVLYWKKKKEEENTSVHSQTLSDLIVVFNT